MNDEEMEVYCQNVNEKFANWIEKVDVMKTPLKELLIEAFFAGYECGSIKVEVEK